MIVGPVDGDRNVLVGVDTRLSSGNNHDLILFVARDSHDLALKAIHDLLRMDGRGAVVEGT